MTAVRSYSERPIIKEPVWKPEVPWYFFSGGLAGASAGLAFGARLTGNPRLARTAQLVALVGASASPPLLIADLGRPMRFYNMFRVFNVTSPMSIGSWLLGAAGTSIGAGATLELLQIFPRLQRLAEAASGTLGMPLATYQGQSGAFAKTAKTLTAAGTLTMALAGRRRAGAIAGGALLLGGAVYQRWAVFKAGFASARDPKYTVVPQRRRLEARARP